MSTFFRMALTATLALGASFSLIGSESVRAEISKMADASTVPQVEGSTSSVFRSAAESVVEQRVSTFDPEPNDPPKRTGGSGTR
ncbi:hypothetical protein [Leptolyngbya sp. NIES-2104]|uniref:hypothetical protein n=1 Tax=Leptolyngbya sp. NIES-2104 TaxID=1552121 RepID=UPI0012E3A59D|nr:hypothetical protein [Leptolyngbya sp. NIES-2104]